MIRKWWRRQVLEVDSAVPGWRWIGLLCSTLVTLGLLGVTVGGSGCGGGAQVETVTVTVTEDHPALDPNATLITISETFGVDPNPVSVSRSAGTVLQWYNDSAEEVTIVFSGAPFGFKLGSKSYSYPHPVDANATLGSYPYYVDRPAATRPPDPPQVDVGG